jgi:hypothetical protein
MNENNYLVGFIKGYKQCLIEIKHWLEEENTDEHISSVYTFLDKHKELKE